MKISCPACSAKYQIADEKVRDRLAKIRCRKCGATIVIDGKVDPPQVATADASQGSAAGAPAAAAAGGEPAGGEPGPGEYSVDLGEGEPVNMSVERLVEAYNNGTITAETYVWKDGMADWQQMGEVPEVVAALNQVNAAPAASPAGQFPGAGAALGLGAAGAASAAAAQATERAATRSGAGRAAATDLFGGIETAGSEEDVTTSAPDPSPPSATGSTFGSGAATGARNESSVLFSLSALTGGPAPAAGPGGAAPAAAPAAPAMAAAASSASSEDSGLIDLKALAATAAPTDAQAAPAPMPFNVGNAPLGMAAPLGGMPAAPPVTADDFMTARRSSKGPYVIGGSIAVVGLALAAAIFFSSAGGDDEETAAAAESLAPATATETARTGAEQADAKEEAAKEEEAKKEAKAEEESKKDEAAKEEAKAEPTTAKVAAKRTYSAPRTTKRAPQSAPAPEPEPKAAAPAPKPKPAPKKKKPRKKSGCNCAPSDLMCAMRCSAR